jgi:hypothetical protein
MESGTQGHTRFTRTNSAKQEKSLIARLWVQQSWCKTSAGDDCIILLANEKNVLDARYKCLPALHFSQAIGPNQMWIRGDYIRIAKPDLIPHEKSSSEIWKCPAAIAKHAVALRKSALLHLHQCRAHEQRCQGPACPQSWLTTGHWARTWSDGALNSPQTCTGICNQLSTMILL